MSLTKPLQIKSNQDTSLLSPRDISIAMLGSSFTVKSADAQNALCYSVDECALAEAAKRVLKPYLGRRVYVQVTGDYITVFSSWDNHAKEYLDVRLNKDARIYVHRFDEYHTTKETYFPNGIILVP